MGWESFDVVKFDHRPLLQGQTRIPKLRSAYNLLLVLEVCNVKSTCRISWAGNLLVLLDLTSFKVKRWFTGFLVDTNLHWFSDA